MSSSNLPTTSLRSGLIASFAAYLCWGFFPLYWRLLSEADSTEVIAHRVIWSAIILGAYFLSAKERRAGLMRDILRLAQQPFLTALLIAAAATAALNWWINVHAAAVGRVTELGIGMFLTPLLSVLFGCIFYGERFTRTRLTAFGLAATGVAILATGSGAIPWYAIGVSTTWAAYGAMKKRITLSPWTSNLVESLLLAPAALLFAGSLVINGTAGFSPDHPGLALALVGTGAVTLVPMLLFAYAAQVLPLYTLGFCQFLNPILTILVGCLLMGEVYREEFTLPLALIGVAVVIFVYSETKVARASTVNKVA